MSKEKKRKLLKQWMEAIKDVTGHNYSYGKTEKYGAHIIEQHSQEEETDQCLTKKEPANHSFENHSEESLGVLETQRLHHHMHTYTVYTYIYISPYRFSKRYNNLIKLEILNNKYMGPQPIRSAWRFPHSSLAL